MRGFWQGKFRGCQGIRRENDRGERHTSCIAILRCVVENNNLVLFGIDWECVGNCSPDKTSGNFPGNDWDALIMPGNGAGRKSVRERSGKYLGRLSPPKPLWHRLCFDLLSCKCFEVAAPDTEGEDCCDYWLGKFYQGTYKGEGGEEFAWERL